MVDVSGRNKPLGGTALRARPQRKTPVRATLAHQVPLHEARLRDAIELFYFAYRSFTAEPDSILAEHGLGRAHHRILYFVGRHPDIAVNALLEVLAVSKQALHAPLRTLLDGKWVAARPDARDRRFKRLRLTEAGRRLESRLTGAQMKHLGSTFADTGDRAEEGWKSVMRKLSERSR